jgi:hypothetical protein
MSGAGASGGYAGIGSGYSGGTTSPIIVSLRVSKRTTPTVSISGNFRMLSGSGATGGISLASDSYVSPSGNGYINVNHSSITTGNAVVFTASNDANAMLMFSAEL